MAAKHKPFTGRHMALVLVCGFSVVIAVNLFMAYQAVGGFQGTVVDNSYVASQNYNGWLAKADAARALGWQVAAHRRADGRVVLETLGVPAAASAAAEAERALGSRDTTRLTFAFNGDGRWHSNEPIAAGRWQLRIAIRAGTQQWAGDSELR